MKFGQILVCCMTNISNMFLGECWRLVTSFRIKQDPAICNSWHLPLLKCPSYSPFQKTKHWNLDITDQ